MKPERADAIMHGMLQSMAGWIAELEELEGRCPGKVSHLLASVRQSRVSLAQMIERDSTEP